MPAASRNQPCVLLSLKTSSWEVFLNKHEFQSLNKDGVPDHHKLLTSDDLCVDDEVLEKYKCEDQDMGRLIMELRHMGRYENKEMIDMHKTNIARYESIIQRGINAYLKED
jgi:hypothetical protein